MFDRESSAIPTCSFCEKTQEQVERLIAGPGNVYICNECVDLSRELLQEDETTTKQRPPSPQLTRISEALHRLSQRETSEQ